MESARWWGTNVYRTIAWLKPPSDEEDYASFQLDPDRSDDVDRPPEVYALEARNLLFVILWRRLKAAMSSRHTVLVISETAKIREDGKTVVATVLAKHCYDLDHTTESLSTKALVSIASVREAEAYNSPEAEAAARAAVTEARRRVHEELTRSRITDEG